VEILFAPASRASAVGEKDWNGKPDGAWLFAPARPHQNTAGKFAIVRAGKRYSLSRYYLLKLFW